LVYISEIFAVVNITNIIVICRGSPYDTSCLHLQGEVCSHMIFMWQGGGGMFLWNITYLPDCMVSHPRRPQS